MALKSKQKYITIKQKMNIIINNQWYKNIVIKKKNFLGNLYQKLMISKKISKIYFFNITFCV